jgi:hypothetical protein
LNRVIATIVMTEVERVNKRAEKAKQTRQRILQAALGTKRTLLKELVDTTIAGDDEPVATMNRPWFRDAIAAGTADTQLRAHVAGTRKILERVASITQMVTAAAATDVEIAQLWPHGDTPRLEVHTAAAEALVAKPGAREGLTAEHAADLLYALLSTQLYLLFVRDRAWPPGQWQQWAYDTLRPQLCST